MSLASALLAVNFVVWSGSNPFDTLIVFQKKFYDEKNFEKSQQTTRTIMKNYPAYKEFNEKV